MSLLSFPWSRCVSVCFFSPICQYIRRVVRLLQFFLAKNISWLLNGLMERVKCRKILTFLASITHLQSEYHSLEPCPLLKKKLMLSESSSLRWECLPITPVSSLSFPVVAGTHRRWQSVIYIRRLDRNWYTSYDLTVLGHRSIPTDYIHVSQPSGRRVGRTKIHVDLGVLNRGGKKARLSEEGIFGESFDLRL